MVGLLIAVAVLFVTALGHGLWCVLIVNRLHSMPMPRRLMQVLSLIVLALGPALPLGFLGWLLATGRDVLAWREWMWTSTPLLAYCALCWLKTAHFMVVGLARTLIDPGRAVLRHQRRQLVSTEPAIAGEPREESEHHFLTRLPGNESLQLDVVEKALLLPRLPAALDGLSIAHLSDLHFTGRVGKAYFSEVVRLANGFDADLVVLTGDLVDRSQCIDWLPDTLGRLRGRHGVYFILGNHDRRSDPPRIRQTLTASGLIDAAGHCHTLTIREQSILLTGNELPWFKSIADLSQLPHDADRPFRIGLSHSPDQFGWARANHIDLLLAGHTHGGQIRLPWIGPLVAPSRHGLKYASGLFYAPPTVMHVSRGISGEFPIRMNCPPELIRLVLHRA